MLPDDSTKSLIIVLLTQCRDSNIVNHDVYLFILMIYQNTVLLFIHIFIFTIY